MAIKESLQYPVDIGKHCPHCTNEEGYFICTLVYNWTSTIMNSFLYIYDNMGFFQNPLMSKNHCVCFHDVEGKVLSKGEVICYTYFTD